MPMLSGDLKFLFLAHSDWPILLGSLVGYFVKDEEWKKIVFHFFAVSLYMVYHKILTFSPCLRKIQK